MTGFRIAIPALGLCACLVSTGAMAADVSVPGSGWSTTGVAGLIAGDYQGSPDDRVLGASPTGNNRFAYVATAGGVTGVSPLALNSDESGFNQTNGSRVVSGSFSAQASAQLTLFFNYVTTDGRGYDDYAWARLVSTNTNATVAWLFTARSANAPDGDGTGDYVPGKVLSEQINYKDLDSKDPNRSVAAVLNDGLPVVGMPGGSSTNWAPLGQTGAGSYGWCWDTGAGCGATGWIRSAYTVAEAGDYYLEIGVTNWGDEVYDSALAFDYSGLGQLQFGNTATLANLVVPPPVPEPETWALMLAGIALVATQARRRSRQA